MGHCEFGGILPPSSISSSCLFWCFLAILSILSIGTIPRNTFPHLLGPDSQVLSPLSSRLTNLTGVLISPHEQSHGPLKWRISTVRLLSWSPILENSRSTHPDASARLLALSSMVSFSSPLPKPVTPTSKVGLNSLALLPLMTSTSPGLLSQLHGCRQAAQSCFPSTLLKVHCGFFLFLNAHPFTRNGSGHTHTHTPPYAHTSHLTSTDSRSQLN